MNYRTISNTDIADIHQLIVSTRRMEFLYLRIN